jgi:hypothetical protein
MQATPSGGSADSKSRFVEGYVAAMRRVNHVLHTDCMDRKNAAKSSADTNALLSEAINLCALAEFFDFDVDAHKLADGADDFYKDSRNTRLAIDLFGDAVRQRQAEGENVR